MEDNKLKELLDSYKQTVVVIFNDDDIRKAEESPIGSLILDGYSGEGYIKR